MSLFNSLFWNQNFLNASCACFSKNINFENLFDPNFLYLQDFDLWLRLASTDKIISKKEKLLKYRVTSTSLSQNVNQDLYKNESMHTELFLVLTKNLSEFSTAEIYSIFEDYIVEFSRPLSNLKTSLESRSFLITFLLLSHNNPILRNLALRKLQREGMVDKFRFFVYENFRAQSKPF